MIATLWPARGALGRDEDRDVRERTEEVTRLLDRASGGDSSAASSLLPLVYGELRALAGALGGMGASGRTLQPTAVVHEAYLKLVGEHRQWESRRHFFEVAAKAMRQVMADHAKAARREKRGGGWVRVPLEGIELPGMESDFADLDEAIERLSALNARHARVVELRFYAGLGVEETARIIGISPRSVEQDWKVARAFLRRALREGGEHDA
jgi:RNA polymerase sigma-70 factor, ECF subfamily